MKLAGNEDMEDIRALAYMHRTSDSCVTPAVGDHPELIYDKPRVLVAWEDVVDRVEWLEKGVGEWRDEALLKAAVAQNLCVALRAAEAFIRRVHIYAEGQPDKHDTLATITMALKGYK